MPITEYSLLKVIASVGKEVASSILSFEDVSSIITHISNQLYSICSEIRGSQLDGAAHSIENAKNAYYTQIKLDELNKAITHLEDAYYLSKRLLDKKTVHEYTYLLFFTGREVVNAVPWRYRRDWIQGQIEICTTLTLIYRYKGTSQLEEKWYNEAFSLYKSFAKKYLELSDYALEDINSDFVYHTTRIEWEKVEYNEFFSKAEKNEIDEIHVTSSGERYREQHLLKLISDFESGLKRAKLL